MKSLFDIITKICLVLAMATGFAQTSVMTYNIRYDTPNDGDNWWEHRKTAVVKLLKHYNADFIGLQEAMPGQLNYVSGQLENYDHIGHGRDGLGSESEGIPIFFKRQAYELLGKEVFWLSTTPNEVSKGWDAALNRIVVYGKFRSKKTNEIIHVLNTHFDHKGRLARLKSASLIIDFINNHELLDKKIVLMGDFNSLPAAAPIELLEREFKGSYAINELDTYGPVGTFNGFNLNDPVIKKIDYIFTKNIVVKKYRCIDDRRSNNLHVSDHFPILIEF